MMSSRVLALGVALCAIVACQAGAGSSGVSAKAQPPSGSASAASSASAPSKAKAARPPAGLSEAEADKACTSIRTASCERTARCNPKFLESSYGDKATCLAREKAVCVAVQTLPGTKLTNEQAEACAKKLAAQPCDATDEIPECTLPGTIADEQTCMSSNQCASGRCDGGTFSKCGTCKPAAKETGAAVGAACTKDKDCTKWASCEGGKCAVAGKAKGQKCNQADSCSLMLDLGCYGTTCASGGAIVEAGASCKYDDKTKTMPYCKKGSFCASDTRKCTPIIKDGDPCNDGRGCMYPATCDKGTKACTLPKFDVAACWQ
jgi:hypothetical protein